MAIPINMEVLIDQRVVESHRVAFKGRFNPAPVFPFIFAFARPVPVFRLIVIATTHISGRKR